MILQSEYHIILILLCSIHALASAQDAATIAQPGCNTTCGNVEIPYPFGMNDPKCYADKWFEIECRSNGFVMPQGVPQPPQPYLKQLNLGVKSIDPLASTININNFAYTLNCQKSDGAAARVESLRGGPFVYSQERNRFVSLGCNRIAFLMSNGSRVSACASICDANEDKLGDVMAGKCNGKYCCETSLPIHLVEYNVTTENLTENNSQTGGGQCSYAMIVEQNAWITTNSSLLGLENFSPEAVLEWEIVDSSMKLTGNCSNTNVTSSQFSHSGRRCYCGDGFYGNPCIPGGCVRTVTPGPDPRRTGVSWGVVLLTSLGSIFLLVGGWLSYKAIRKRIIRKRKEKFFKKNGGLLLQQKLSSSGGENVDKVVLFSLKELEKATDNFNLNRVLGKGGQGTVYKGMLTDGKIVAVKKFKVEGKTEEFVNEFVVLSQINHRNVVKLLGCCLETEIPLLVYEFIPNGNLFEYLHDQSEDLPMTWDMRLRIATEIAGALFYLHSVASQPIYHRDIKSTNILLDEKYRAKVADFGTSRIVSIEATHLTTAVQGTFGYLDPEYFYTSQFTDKSDVYSFGVVLVELLTRKKPIMSISSEEARSLASHFVVSMDENRFLDIIDKRVEKEGEREHIIAVANLAYRCLELNGRKRPTMKEVTLELEGIQRLVKKSDVQQNLEEQENDVDRVEDYQHHWTGYSTSDTFPTTSDGELLSDVMPIFTFK